MIAPRLVVLMTMLLSACDAPRPAPAVATNGTKVEQEDTIVQPDRPAARSDRSLPSLAPPRTPFPATLEPIWESVASDTDTILLAPNDLMFSRLGLLVFDVGDRTVQVLRSHSGGFRRRLGREGSGPGELSRAMWFQGSYGDPSLFDGIARRLLRLDAGDSSFRTEATPRDRSWNTTCALDQRTTLALAHADSGRELFTFESATLQDSLETPWPHLRDEHLLARQAILRQIDDSSCVALTIYQPDFALITTRRTVRAGRYVDQLPPVSVVRTMHADKRSFTVSLPRGTVGGPYSAGGWRGNVVVLQGGKGPMARRLLDVYDRADLAYRGTLLLPFPSRRLAIRGDTLAVIGEKDDYPVVGVFRLKPR